MTSAVFLPWTSQPVRARISETLAQKFPTILLGSIPATQFSSRVEKQHPGGFSASLESFRIRKERIAQSPQTQTHTFDRALPQTRKVSLPRRSNRPANFPSLLRILRKKRIVWFCRRNKRFGDGIGLVPECSLCL